MEELTLGGLASEDVAALLTQSTRPQPVDRLAGRVRAKTAGNPFFIEELIRHMTDTADGALAAKPIELPASIKQAISRRVTQLGSEAVALLTAGAVLGPEFDLELAAEVEGLPLDAALRALDHAVRSGLIVEVSGPPGRVTFTHALVRDALAGSLTAARRARLHALAAAALEPRAERDPDRHLQALVHHALEGAPMSDQPQRAAELAQQAAARATAAYAHEESARLLQRALAVLRRIGAEPDRQVTVLCALGEALERSGEHKRALKVLGEALDLARRLARSPADGPRDARDERRRRHHRGRRPGRRREVGRCACRARRRRRRSARATPGPPVDRACLRRGREPPAICQP